MPPALERILRPAWRPCPSSPLALRPRSSSAFSLPACASMSSLPRDRFSLKGQAHYTSRYRISEPFAGMAQEDRIAACPGTDARFLGADASEAHEDRVLQRGFLAEIRAVTRGRDPRRCVSGCQRMIHRVHCTMARISHAAYEGGRKAGLYSHEAQRCSERAHARRERRWGGWGFCSFPNTRTTAWCAPCGGRAYKRKPRCLCLGAKSWISEARTRSCGRVLAYVLAALSWLSLAAGAVSSPAMSNPRAQELVLATWNPQKLRELVEVVHPPPNDPGHLFVHRVSPMFAIYVHAYGEKEREQESERERERGREREGEGGRGSMGGRRERAGGGWRTERE